MTDKLAFDRRRFLQCSTAALGTALAGCLGSETNETYADWIPAYEGFTLVALDLTEATDDTDAGRVVPALLPSEDAILGDTNERPSAGRYAVAVDTDDPLLGFPVRASSAVLTWAALGVGVSGLYELVDGTAEQPAHKMIILGDSIVLTGQFDTEYVDGRLRSEGPYPRLKIEHQVVGEFDEQTLYGTVDGERESESIVAVGNEAIVFGEDRDAIERVIETSAGERDSAPERFDTVEWLVESVETGNVVVGQFGDSSFGSYGIGEQQLLGTFSPADDILASLSLDETDETATAEIAFTTQEVESERRQRLESTLGQEGRDRSTTAESGRFAVSATYSADTLETTRVIEDESPAEVEFEPEIIDEKDRVVADVRFDDPEKGFAMVIFADDIAATVDRIRVETVVNEGTRELPGSIFGGSVGMFLDPDGDQVVVTAVSNGTEEVVHRETYHPSE